MTILLVESLMSTRYESQEGWKRDAIETCDQDLRGMQRRAHKHHVEARHASRWESAIESGGNFS